MRDMAHRTRTVGLLAVTALPLVVLGLAFGLPGPRVWAHPLFRIHVRPSAYRLAPPRLPRLRLPSVVGQVAALVPQAALVSTASPVRAAIIQAPLRALIKRH